MAHISPPMGIRQAHRNSSNIVMSESKQDIFEACEKSKVQLEIMFLLGKLFLNEAGWRKIT